MKERHEHVITAVTGDAQPQRLVALACDVNTHGAPGGKGGQRETLRSWSSCGWERQRDGSYRHWSVETADAARWWRAVLWGSKRRGVTWVVANRAVRIASLLGLWRMIDDGQIAWDEAGPARRAGRGNRVGVQHVPSSDGSHDESTRPNILGRVSGVRDALPDAECGRGHAERKGGHGSASACIEDPPTILRLRVPGRPGRLWLLDSRNWGIEPDAEFATAKGEAAWLAATMRRMVQCLEERGWGGLKATAGSQALATWRRAFLTHEVVAHADDEVLGLEEAAYIGGRCECYRIGRVAGPLYQVDRRSAYGHACATLDVPVSIKGRHDGQWDLLRDDPDRSGRCLAEAGIECDSPTCAQATGHGFRYPVGRWTCVLAGPELRDGIESGAVRWIGRCVEYECQPALRDAGRAFWAARQAFQASGDRELESWVKKLAACLPGKLGQRVSSWEHDDTIKPPARWAAWWGTSRKAGLAKLRCLSGSCHRQIREGWTYDAVPAIACWVLSAARVELLRAIRVAGWCNVVYCDTDSLLLSQDGWDALAGAPGYVGDGLGQWRLQRTCSEAEIRGVKHYVLDDQVTCAGLPRQGKEPTRLADYYWYRDTFGVALSEHHSPEAARRLRKFRRAPKYVGGRIGDGGVVYPFVVNEWEE